MPLEDARKRIRGLEGTDPFGARGTRRAESKAINGSVPPP